MSKINNETEFILSSEFYGFTTIQNYILEDPRITDNAIGLYMRIIKFQNSPTHKIYLKGLVTEVNKRTKVTNAMNELIELGYITREEIRESGRFKGYKYNVFMKPQNTLKPCKISALSECRKTASGKTEIGKTTSKKENILKTKISKKENKTTTTKEVVVIDHNGNSSTAPLEAIKKEIQDTWSQYYMIGELPLNVLEFLIKQMRYFEKDVVLELIGASTRATKNPIAYMERIAREYRKNKIVTYDDYFNYTQEQEAERLKAY